MEMVVEAAETGSFLVNATEKQGLYALLFIRLFYFVAVMFICKTTSSSTPATNGISGILRPKSDRSTMVSALIVSSSSEIYVPVPLNVTF
jgi:hypothetical protein